MRLGRLSRSACLALSVHCAMAQYARVEGIIADPSRAPLPDASITLANQDTGVYRQLLSDQQGRYSFSLLDPGRYRVSVLAEGFRPVTRANVKVDVNQNLRLDFPLELGTVTETITVDGAPTLLSLADATIGAVIGHRSITSLPLNGRNVLSLVTLTPNVRFNASSPSGFADRGGTLAVFQVNGGPPGANNVEIDGTTNINSRLGDINVNPGVDAIEEFKVQSAVIPAESGFTLGGLVSMVTRSGSNRFHGTLYEFVRNQNLDARSTFASNKAPLHYNQFGGALGGPLVRDKAFFFVNSEQWRLAQSYTALGTTPTAAQRAGDFSHELDAQGARISIYDPETTRPNPTGGYSRDPFPENRIPVSLLDPVAMKVLPFYPEANRTPDNPLTDLNNFSANLGTYKQATQLNLKGDYNATERDRLALRFSVWNHQDDQAANGLGIFPSRLARVRSDRYNNDNWSLSEQHAFSAGTLNSVRVGIGRQPFGFTPLSYGQDWPRRLGLPASVPNLILPIFNIAGYQQLPTSFLGSIGRIGLLTVQLADALTWIRGGHTFKFGTDLRRYNTNLNLCQQCNGTFNFNSRLTANPQSLVGTGSGLASFLLGNVASATIDYNAGASYYSYSFSFFAQDDWKVTPRLTLNLGLRYDYQQPTRESHNNLSSFNPNAKDPNTGLMGRMEYANVDFGRSLEDPDSNDWGPRVGFAYNLFGNSRTVVRGGIGAYYQMTPMFANDYSTQGFRPNVTSYTAPGGNADAPAFLLSQGFPFAPIAPQGPRLGPSGFLGQTVSMQERSGRTPLSQQFTLSLQHQIKGFVLDAGYSGNKGTNLRGAGYDYNQMDPQYLSLGSALQNSVANPYAGVTGTFGGTTITRSQLLRPYPYYGNINVNQPHYASSIYHSYLLSAQRRMASGLEFLASFTFGKLISDAVIGANFGSGLEGVSVSGNQDGKYNRRLDRSVDATDSAKRLVLSGVYHISCRSAGTGGSRRRAGCWICWRAGGR